MADRTRNYDWGQTPVGTIEQWPDTLLVMVNLLLGSRQPMFLWWGVSLVQFYNDAYRPSLGADKHPTALGKRGLDCWSEIWPTIYPQIDAVMTSGKASWSEDQLVPIYRDGKLEDVYWTYGYSPVRDPSGKIQGTLVTCYETTRKVLATQQLQQDQARLADLFEQAPAFFAVLRGPWHVFELTNPLYRDLVGRDVIGKSLREAVPEAEEQGFIALLDRVYRTGEPFVGRAIPINLARVAGEPVEQRFLDFVYQPMRKEDNTICGIIVLGVDVTETKRAERTLMQTEKLAAVGRLASSLAHEINNPLEAITNLLYLSRNSEELSEIHEYLSTAERELRRMSVISNQTLRFYKQTTQPTPVDLDSLVEEIATIYHSRIVNAGIRIEHRKGASLTVLCFEGEIRQVLVNLIGNAIDAMPQGGRLLMRSREATNWRTGVNGLVLTIADTGSGIDPTAARHIFEAFFTTKGASGTGLGLWISKEIVDRHHGMITVRSGRCANHNGTIFSLFLPFNAAIRLL